MRWKNSIDAYGSVSMLFHWVTAAAFFVRKDAVLARMLPSRLTH
jgi:cytochrome b561